MILQIFRIFPSKGRQLLLVNNVLATKRPQMPIVQHRWILESQPWSISLWNEATIDNASGNLQSYSMSNKGRKLLLANYTLAKKRLQMPIVQHTWILESQPWSISLWKRSHEATIDNASGILKCCSMRNTLSSANQMLTFRKCQQSKSFLLFSFSTFLHFLLHHQTKHPN